jgi:branched-chain amino acid transport system ATP-binding protein
VIILKTESVKKSFGAFCAVNRVSIEVHQGQIVLIIGPNGSGKTTLLDCISGFYKPDEGTIIHRSINITGRSPSEIVNTGLLRTFQIPAPFTSLTVLENLLVAYQGNPGENPFRSIFRRKWLEKENTAVKQAFKILELLSLDSKFDAPASELSGGQLKLLELGRTLMLDAKTILLDEPVGSVNPVLAHTIFSKITDLRTSLGLAFVIVEHRIDIAMQYVDFVFAMSDGGILSKGSPEEVVNDSKVLESYLGS